MNARDKIKSLSDLTTIAELFHRKGRHVVLTNGVFDLLHLGHVRYFEEAKRQGDILFVTITADDFVNKGPSRPHFPHDLRAEMVAALECVDGVVITHEHSAVTVIDAIKPDVYVKGPDYKDATGTITEERQAAERHGGRIHFTDDITFSSSALINQHLETSDLREYLDRDRQQHFADTIPDLMTKLAGLKVLVVGETIIDKYVYVSPLGKPPKENVLATLRQNSELFAGGAVATANHVASFCDRVELLTCIGNPMVKGNYYDIVQAATTEKNIKLHIVIQPGPTVRKTRFVDSAYLRKLFEVYTMDDSVSADVHYKLIEEIDARAKDFDVVLVNDFGHGMITPGVRNALYGNSKFMALNVQSNAGNFGYNLATKYARADYLCLDAPEARLAVSAKDAKLDIIAAELAARIEAPRIILTHGSNGCLTYSRGTVSRVPAFTRRVVDTMGAGDAFFAVTGPLASITDDLDMVGFVGNAVGAIKVGILGHRKAVDKTSTLAYIRTLLK